MLGKIELLSLLRGRDIAFTYEEHDPVLSMAESGLLTLSLEGTRCKNLLLKDKHNRNFLVVTTAKKSLDLAALAKTLACKRLSFVSSDKLIELLGIRTGSLSPFALVNDRYNNVQLVVDCDLREESSFLFHPLDNNASVSITKAALTNFLTSIDHAANWLHLSARSVE